MKFIELLSDAIKILVVDDVVDTEHTTRSIFCAGRLGPRQVYGLRVQAPNWVGPIS
jgi:hypothetical protein